MSRSYKHTPRSGDTKDKFFKNYSNRKIRRKKLTHSYQHNAYKKELCSYDICDYETVGTTFEDFYNFRVKIRQIWHKDDEPSREEEYQNYAKWFLRK